jgi:hypothetical protein
MLPEAFDGIEVGTLGRKIDGLDVSWPSACDWVAVTIIVIVEQYVCNFAVQWFGAEVLFVGGRIRASDN